jgi:hypothetical protein
VLTGAGSVIDLLLHCVADAGDAVLIPAPYYPAFDNDLKVCLFEGVFVWRLLNCVCTCIGAQFFWLRREEGKAGGGDNAQGWAQHWGGLLLG